MTDEKYMQIIEKRSHTISRFNRYRKQVIKSLKIDEEQYSMIQGLIIKYFGYFDIDKTYCGPGKWGDKLVPDLIYKFAGYTHDSIYYLIEIGVLDRKKWKKKADKWFRVIMRNKSTTPIGKGVAEVYYFFVSMFGNPKPQVKSST